MQNLDPTFKEINMNEAYHRYCESHWTAPEDPEGESGLVAPTLWGVSPIEHSLESFTLKMASDIKFRKKWA